MIDCLLLDLDNTILDFTKAEYYALGKTLQAYQLDPTEQVRRRYSQINREHWERLERQELSREQVVVGRFEALFREFGMEADPVAVAGTYEDNLIGECCFIPGAKEALRRLSEQYSVYLVTNGTAHVQWPKLDIAGIRHWFRDIFISEEMGANKPSPAYFDSCFARIPGFRKERAMIVGDSLTSDILGGINAGIATCWINRFREPGRPDIVPDHQLEHLNQLEALLKTLNK